MAGRGHAGLVQHSQDPERQREQGEPRYTELRAATELRPPQRDAHGTDAHGRTDGRDQRGLSPSGP